ncbi:molecular chaperone-like protein [Oscillochloris trichoides DG-6]|uniref:Molecular chaperone-like protein n=1 Tax=Oscillochloris trichoides DG-6 TaxID=765420 RepID=E1IEP7_9CHLR|nr:Hsp70 family protein [Oscillochloris trichoides]EFO80339.1 molecular chaperone-like protein [Oscillochloris trichoides DG-6]
MWVGLDFGTTNSSAAIYDGQQLTLLPLDPVNRNPSILRSTLFMTREGAAYIGREAINRFTEGNVGREVEYAWKYIGDAEVTFAGLGTRQQALYAKVDANAPGRLFQSMKSGLRDRAFSHTNVFGTAYTLEALIAIVLRLIYERIEASIGQPVTGLVIGRPVHYAAHPQADALAFTRMQAACQLAELPNVTFLEEPTGAALAYARTVRHEEHVLIFDFGGGTLDVTIMRLDGRGKREFLATDGVPVGGDLLEQRLVMGRLLPHFGAGATLGPRRLPFPTHILEHLSEWQMISEMTQPKYLEIIDEAVAIGDRKRELKALRSLVRQNYGLPMYEAVERAKVELSEREQTILGMHMGEIDFDESIPRWDFERLIGPDVRAVEACIDRALAAADLRPNQIDVVLRTGGSSRIPRFVRMLNAKFGADKLQEMDVFTGVASGMAVAAYERGQQP